VIGNDLVTVFFD